MKAVIDIGTNSILLLIGQFDKRNKIECIFQKFNVTRLGEGLIKTGILQQNAMKRSLAVLREYAIDIDNFKVENVIAIGTQALRMAQNANQFTEMVRDEFGWDIKIISGEEEAKYSFLGALDAVDVANEPVVVIDVGGGSTEIIFGVSGEIQVKVSLPVGVVRFAENLDMKVKLDEKDRKQITDWAILQFSKITFLDRLKDCKTMIGVGGTVTTLVAIIEKMKIYEPDFVNGYILDKETLWNIFYKLNEKSLTERQEVPGLVKGREDVILYGILIILALMDYVRKNQITASDRGIRFGYLKSLQLSLT
jgi:exopolyphosphatase/guanosine-5'-triphosphate,3'-diphosphate pyrophosphatase